jgi:hypothetical protein
MLPRACWAVRFAVLAALVAQAGAVCSLGQFFSGTCQNCPAGKYTTTNTATVCTNCPANTQSTAVGPGFMTMVCRTHTGASVTCVGTLSNGVGTITDGPGNVAGADQRIFYKSTGGVGNAITVSFSVFDIAYEYDWLYVYSCTDFGLTSPYACNGEKQITGMSGSFALAGSAAEPGNPHYDDTTATWVYWQPNANLQYTSRTGYLKVSYFAETTRFGVQVGFVGAVTGAGASNAGTCVKCAPNSQSVAGSGPLTSCLCNAGYTGPLGGSTVEMEVRAPRARCRTRALHAVAYIQDLEQ